MARSKLAAVKLLPKLTTIFSGQVRNKGADMRKVRTFGETPQSHISGLTIVIYLQYEIWSCLNHSPYKNGDLGYEIDTTGLSP
jgi:hypothetical protein